MKKADQLFDSSNDVEVETAACVDAVTPIRHGAGRAEHFAQFYLDDQILIASVADYVRRGIDSGAAAIVVATEPHSQALESAWGSCGFDAAAARGHEQLIMLDAGQALATFMVDGVPDRELFFTRVGEFIQRAARGHPRVIAFGEMAPLVWKEGQPEAAVQLEQLWNELAAEHVCTMYCAYPLRDCAGAHHVKAFEAVCASHTRVIPAESHVTQSPQEQLQTIVQLQQKVLVLEETEAALGEREQALRQAHVQLQSRTAELAQFNQAAVGREMRVIELKAQINALREQRGEALRYALDPDRQEPPAVGVPAAGVPAATATATATATAAAAAAAASASTAQRDGLVPLESILRIEQLHQRPRRPADYESENRALSALAQALADSPNRILQTLADKVVEVLQAGSAGLSLLTSDGARFYWAAIAGQWSPHVGGGTPREFGPCGDVLDGNAPLLFTHWEQRYPYLAAATPLAEEGLLVPFHVDGKAVGTIWAIAHDPQRRFDSEDLRQLESLGRFASAAYQSKGALEQRQAALSILEDAYQSRQIAQDSNRKLRESEQALREADRHRNEFLALLGHELRNPLAPITHASELLSRTLAHDTRARVAIDMIKRQTAQLTHLVDDLLDVSRITQGRIQLQRTPLDLAGVIAQALETVEPQLRAKQHNVSIISSHQPLYVSGDLVRLVQCVVNVLGNAAKYTDPQGQIRVQTRAQDSSAIIEIVDSGAGIAPDLIPRIFDLFVQSERTLDRAQGGLGIGLSVVKRLMEMHDGQISVRSAGLGHGSTFEIRLPQIARPDAPAVQAVQGPAQSRRVLIVDDNEDAANSLALLLSLAGHDTHVVFSGEEALERIESFQPDVALLDIGLPRMNGYELAQRLRTVAHLKTTRLVALSGYGQAQDRQRSHAAGFDDHIVKPVDLPALERTLAAAIPGR